MANGRKASRGTVVAKAAKATGGAVRKVAQAAKQRATATRTAATKRAGAPVPKKTAAKATASKAPAKAAAKPAGGRGSASKAAPSKAAPKAAAGKAAAAKASSTKSAPKKAAAKVAPAKKTATVKAQAKKAPAKKAPAPGRAAPSKPTKLPAKAEPLKSAKATAVKHAPAKAPAPAKPPPARAALSESFLAEQRSLLHEERQSYLNQAEQLKAEADSLALEHEPGDTQFDEEGGEGGTANIDRELDLALSARALAAIDEIDQALAKIDAGTYGVCEQCGQPIPQPRLRALPYAALCVACKSGGLSRRV